MNGRGTMTGKLKKFDDLTSVAAVVAAYRAGVRTKTIAEDHGVCRVTIESVLRRNGVVLDQRKSRRDRTPSEEKIQEMIRLYTVEELNTHQVAARLGVGSSTVVRHLNDRGVAMRAHVKRHRLTPDQRRELADRYAAGETFAALQGAYSVSDSIVEACLDEFGIAHRTGWGRFHAPPWTDARGRTWTFKSRWELAYAQHLDAQGLAWDYEARKFGLRTCKCYTPDFVVDRDGVDEYHEVKGWLDDRTIARMQEFARTYPARRLVLVGPRELVDLGLIEAWYAQHLQAARVTTMREWLEVRYRHANTCARAGAR
jgi:transposase